MVEQNGARRNGVEKPTRTSRVDQPKSRFTLFEESVAPAIARRRVRNTPLGDERYEDPKFVRRRGLGRFPGYGE